MNKFLGAMGIALAERSKRDRLDRELDLRERQIEAENEFKQAQIRNMQRDDEYNYNANQAPTPGMLRTGQRAGQFGGTVEGIKDQVAAGFNPMSPIPMVGPQMPKAAGLGAAQGLNEAAKRRITGKIRDALLQDEGKSALKREEMDIEQDNKKEILGIVPEADKFREGQQTARNTDNIKGRAAEGELNRKNQTSLEGMRQGGANARFRLGMDERKQRYQDEHSVGHRLWDTGWDFLGTAARHAGGNLADSVTKEDKPQPGQTATPVARGTDLIESIGGMAKMLNDPYNVNQTAGPEEIKDSAELGRLHSMVKTAPTEIQGRILSTLDDIMQTTDMTAGDAMAAIDMNPDLPASMKPGLKTFLRRQNQWSTTTAPADAGPSMGSSFSGGYAQ